MNDDWFIIKDLKGFINGTRVLVFMNFGLEDQKPPIQYTTIDELQEKDQQELNKILSYEESLVIVKSHITKQTNKKSKKTRYILSENNYADIVSDLNQRLVSNLMTQLVKKGLVETAFDDEANDFVFWVKDYDKQKENPETD